MTSYVRQFSTEIIRQSSGATTSILTDGQVEQLLNYFLLQSIEPIMQTLWFKNELALVLNRSIRGFRDKVTSKDKKSALTDLFNLIFCFDKDQNVVNIRLAEIDRSYLQNICFKFLDIGKVLLDADKDFNRSYLKGELDLKSSDKIAEITDYFHGLSVSFITRAYKKVNYWINNYLLLKERILKHYYLFAYKFALRTAFHRQNIDAECLFKSLLIAMDTALGKYVREKGVLSSYFLLWFKSTLSRPSFDFEMGKPYNMPDYAKKFVKNPAILQTIDLESEEFQFNEAHIVEQIEEYFSEIDLDFLKFLDSVQDVHVDLVKIILGLPKINSENLPNYSVK